MPQLSDAQVDELRAASYNASVASIRLHNEELGIFRIRPDYPIPEFRAGQYTTLGLGYWEQRAPGCQDEDIAEQQLRKLVKRAYSISNPILGEDGQLLRTEGEDFLEFYVVLVRDAARRPPALTPRLFDLEVGSRLFVGEKITGHYTLEGVQPDDTVLFLSTGTGEAPHNAMLLELLRNQHRGKILSAVCVRYQRDLGYLDTHRHLVETYPQYSYVTLTTREEWNRGNKMYIQDVIKTGKVEEQIDQSLEPNCTHVFLCGNPSMIGAPEKDATGNEAYPQPEGVVEILEQRGFKADRPHQRGNVHFEKYW